MKVKPDFELRTVAGENILVATGKMSTNFSKLISLKDSAAYLWKEVSAMPSFEINTLADLLVKRYDIDNATVLVDASMIIDEWLKAGVIEK